MSDFSSSVTVPVVSVIIVSYNTAELLSRCLASLLASADSERIEVIVVDNGSSDRSPEMVRRDFPTVRLQARTSNSGFAAANNEGARFARAEHLLLLNSDTEVAGDAVLLMSRYLDEHSTVGIVGPQLLNSDGTLQPSGNKVPSFLSEVLLQLPIRGWFGLSGESRFYDPRRDYSREAKVEEVSGACLMVRRSLWNELQGLDERYFFYYEDVDFCVRARRIGWTVMYVPSARVLHHWGRSTKQPSPAFVARCMKGYFHFIRKVHGPVAEVVMRALIMTLSASKVAAGAAMKVTGCDQTQLIQVNHALFRVSVGLQA